MIATIGARAKPLAFGSSKLRAAPWATAAKASPVGVRRYAIAAKPAPPATLDQSDADMWKAYANAMKNDYFPQMNPNAEAFFVAPISKVGIASGKGVDPRITAKGIYDCADPMPLLTTGVFGASDDSYATRMSTYLNAVRLNRNPDRGALLRLQQAKTKVDGLVDKKQALEEKARTAYTADTDKGTQTFKQWITANYPNLVSLMQELQAASATVASLTAQVEGPGAAQLNRYKTGVFNALDPMNSWPGYNMSVCDLPADQLAETPLPADAPAYLRPAYSIDSGYAGTVDSWIARAGAENMSKVSINFDANMAKSSKWSDVGITQWSTGASAGYGFFSASFFVNGKEVHEQVTSSQAGSSMSVSVTASGIGTFSVKPGAWAVEGMEKNYPTLESQSDAVFPAGGRVTDLVMGYNVGMNINLKSETQQKIHELTEKAVSSGGSVKFFGFEIPLGGSGSGSSDHKKQLDQMFSNGQGSGISLPNVDTGYPVLLAVKCQKLPEIQPKKV